MHVTLSPVWRYCRCTWRQDAMSLASLAAQSDSGQYHSLEAISGVEPSPYFSGAAPCPRNVQA